MSDVQGKFQYLAPDGAVAEEGTGRVHFDEQTLTLTPQSGAALTFDLGDLDSVTGANYEVRLALYTGRKIVLRQLGKAFETFAHDLIEAYRNRAVQCLLLEDMGEIARFPASIELSGTATASGTAEIRLYQSNVAVLPAASAGFQWRLADIDDVKVNAAAYEVTLHSGNERLKVTRLAKRTEEFAAKVEEALNALATNTSQSLHAMLPFLGPDQLRACAGLLREGRSAPLAKLAAIHKQIPGSLAANAVDTALKPYYDALVARSASGLGYAGFKLIRPEERENERDPASQGYSDEDATDQGTASADSDAAGPETVYWFLYPLAAKPGSSFPPNIIPANVVAWEASSRSGRATYFFRMVDPAKAAKLGDATLCPALVDSAIGRISRALGMLNFRRRPIYLSDDELAMDPRFHRYAIAARRLPEVRQLRASFLGRALHSSVDAWQAQVESIVSKAEA